MNVNDWPDFYAEWMDAHAMSSSNQEPRESTVQAVFDVLSEYSLQNVIGALREHAKRSRFAPTPADICELIDARSGAKHLGADEAWALALKSFDERSTVVVTKEILEARGLALDVYCSGDVIAARIAFRDAYNRIVGTAGKPRWFVTAGTDPVMRVEVIQKAIALGQITEKSAKQFLIESKTKTTATVAGLLESAEKKAGNDSAPLESIRKFKAMVAGMQDGSAGIERREQKRQEFENHRQLQLSKVAQKAKGLH